MIFYQSIFQLSDVKKSNYFQINKSNGDLNFKI